MDFLIEWLQTSGGIWFYLIIFASALAENLFTPLPGDTVTVFGAYLAGKSGFSLVGTFIASTGGGTLGFMGLYVIGRLLYRRGARRSKLLGVKFISIDKIGGYFGRWGYFIILFNRFLYGIRFAVAIFAGIAKLPWQKTLVFTLLGTSIWNVILVYAGGLLGENWEEFKGLLWKYNKFIFAGIILLTLVVAFWKINRIVAKNANRNPKI